MVPTDILRRSVLGLLTGLILASATFAQTADPPVVLGRGPMQLDETTTPAQPPSYYQPPAGDPPPSPDPTKILGGDLLGGGPEAWTSPEGLSSSLQVVLLLTVLSMAPAVLLMTTCYVRIIIVLGLLRQALGLQSLPPSQVMTSLALFMTLFVMGPVWTEVYDTAIEPYTDPDVEMTLQEAGEAASLPIRKFMARQIDVAGNHEDVHLFYEHMDTEAVVPSDFGEVPLRVLLPAYILSELKTAFLMGFQIYLPFLIVDLVVASVTISMGMLMLPPAIIALPFKLLLFVLVDGWRLVVEMLMDSFGTVPVA